MLQIQILILWNLAMEVHLHFKIIICNLLAGGGQASVLSYPVSLF